MENDNEDFIIDSFTMISDAIENGEIKEKKDEDKE